MRLSNTPAENRLAYIFDLDGVIYRGNEPQPFAREAVQALRDQGHIVRFYTNNSSQTRSDYADKLESMGIPTPVEEIMTSSYATALYFIEKNALGKTVYQIGERGITEELAAVGMNVITNCAESDAPIDYVVVGIDRNFHYDKLARAQKAILAGAKFIATNEDPTFPIEGGELMPGGGSIVAAVRTATATQPFVIGKPQTYAFNKILELVGIGPDRAVMVGDRLNTDVAVGNRAGACTVLVLTGVTTREQAEKAVGDQKPDRVIQTLGELLS